MIVRLRTVARDERGFSLMDSLIAMVFMGVLFAAFALLMSVMIHRGDEVERQTTMQVSARFALERLATDLRQAYTGIDGQSPIEVIGPSSLRFLSLDKAQPFKLRRIEYRLTSGTLERRQALGPDTDPANIPALGAWRPELTSVKNTTLFTFYDGGNPPAVTSTASLVRSIAINFTVATVSAPTATYPYTSNVTLRITPS
jgi:type II secretory pathway component PulJ